MNLSYPLLNEPLSFDENRINVMIIENPKALREAIFTLQQQIAGDSGDFALSKQFEPIELSKYAAFVVNPFDLVLESKKIAGKLTRAACEAGEDYADAFYRIAADINALAAQIGTSMDFDVAFTPLESMETLVELLKFHVDREDMDFPEQILTYIRLYRSFFGIQLFVFYNLKACLSEDELISLYKSVCYEKMHMLLIEDVQRGHALEKEKTVIIDKDLCVL
jgi:CRISPR-associated protein Csn2